MINAIIIDDELHCINNLRNLLNGHFGEDIEVCGAFRSVEEGMAGIQKLNPDLVFLDVRLHEQTGFDLLKQFDKIDFALIFITAYDKYAIEAFRFSAIDYLLKPVALNNLTQAIDKLKERFSVESNARKYEALFYNLKHSQTASRRICVPAGTKLVVIQIGDIVRCESSGNYTNIFLKDGSKLVASRTLKEFENMLEEYDFHRVHNSDLINLAYVKSYNKGTGGTVLMGDNKEVEVSVRRKEDFLKKLNKM